MHEDGGRVTSDAATPSRWLAATGFLPNHSGGRPLLNSNHRAGQPITMAPDEDWRRRLTTSHTRFAQNDRVAPDITAVVPVYNTPAAHLDECVRSLLRQTVRPREILVIDDGTTLAETNTYLNALRDLPDVRLVRNDRNISLGPTMNRALRLCQTEFLLKLDSDDLARPQLIEKFVAFLVENRNVDVVGCQSQNFGISDFVTNHPQRVTRDYVLSRYWFVNHTGILLNKTSLLAVNGYRSMRRLAEDYELWIRMMLYGYRRFYNLPDVLVEYRDLPTGLHRNLRGKLNRAMKIVLRTLMRSCPNF
jgi:glycosyltransferase involved in cell wall biosynthesis